jgi:hypothetical protein
MGSGTIYLFIFEILPESVVWSFYVFTLCRKKMEQTKQSPLVIVVGVVIGTLVLVTVLLKHILDDSDVFVFFS